MDFFGGFLSLFFGFGQLFGWGLAANIGPIGANIGPIGANIGPIGANIGPIG
jgi:hypothetical protein